MERIPASERTREHLKALMEGKSPVSEASSELVRLAARLVIEEALEGEAADALGRGAQPGLGYRNASRDLSEFELVYLFVDGIAERLHLGQPREAVLAAWGILADGKPGLDPTR
jgi:transposase-like protein